MEPMNCTAKVTADKCEVWVATQNGEGSLAAAAEASGLPLAKCEVYKLPPRRRLRPARRVQDYVTRRCTIAKQMPGVPVKLIWSREEDMRQGRFRPVGMCKMSARARRQGRSRRLCTCASRRQSILAYAAPARLENGKDFVAFQGLNPQGPEGQFGYTSRTCWSSTPCATRTCRRASGAASTTTRTRSGSSASWTSWPRRPARTRWSSAAR